MYLKFVLPQMGEDPEFSDRMSGTRLNIGKFKKLSTRHNKIDWTGFDYVIGISEEQKTALSFNCGVGFHIWHNGMPQAALTEICSKLKDFCAAQNISVVVTDNGLGFPGNKTESWFIFGDVKNMFAKALEAEIDLPISTTWHNEILEDIGRIAKGGRKK